MKSFFYVCFVSKLRSFVTYTFLKYTVSEPVIDLSSIPIPYVTAVLKQLTVTPSFQMANFWPPMLRKMSLKNGEFWRVLIVSVWRVYFCQCVWPDRRKRQLLVTGALVIKKRECRTQHRPGRYQPLYFCLQGIGIATNLFPSMICASIFVLFCHASWSACTFEGTVKSRRHQWDRLLELWARTLKRV